MNEGVAAVASTSASVPSAASPRAHRFVVGFWISLILAALAVAIAYVYFRIFSRFQPYDDEGFILISLKSFLQGKPLYDEVYSMYQPGFYMLYGLLFKITGWSLGHDNVRLVTLVLWLVGAGLNGLLTYRLSRSPFLGMAVGLVSVRCLESFANEPGHPQALAYVLVATVVTLFTLADSVPTRRFAIAVGSLTGLILLIKINVGLFILLPVALLFAAKDASKSAASIRIGSSIVMIGLPSLLWRKQLAASATPLGTLALFVGLALALVLAGPCLRTRRRTIWLLAAFFVCAVALFQTSSTSVQALPVFNAGLLTLGISTAVMMCLAQPAGSQPPRSWPWAVLGWSLVVAAILSITLLQGTTLKGLADGLFWWPAKVSANFLIRPRSSWMGPMLGLIGAGSCSAYLSCRGHAGHNSSRLNLIAFAQIGFGLLVLAEFFLRRPGSSTLMPLRDDLPHFWMLPFAWLVAVPVQATETSLPCGGRLALLMIAVMQPLIACPVAGTQLVPASMLLPVLAAVCLAMGLRSLGLRKWLARTEWWRFIAETVGAAVLLGFFGSETVGAAKAYAALTPLNLPGAQRIRLGDDEVRVYRQVVSEVARPEVDTFLTLPGLDSFYFWAKKDPPNSLNVSAWVILLDPASQERIWQAAQSRAGLRVIRNRGLIRIWMKRRVLADLPLVRHIETNFVTIANYGDYEVMARREASLAEPSPAPR
jgi:hypothetical protein